MNEPAVRDCKQIFLGIGFIIGGAILMAISGSPIWSPLILVGIVLIFIFTPMITSSSETFPSAVINRPLQKTIISRSNELILQDEYGRIITTREIETWVHSREDY